MVHLLHSSIVNIPTRTCVHHVLTVSEDKNNLLHLQPRAHHLLPLSSQETLATPTDARPSSSVPRHGSNNQIAPTNGSNNPDEVGRLFSASSQT